ncbi:tRNA glutamyl-Q(34) synthetase GluQRS [Thalassotalea sp. LPB0316]|uniref:tRNA glutamyl-Q(34) synthetase GluQRS n=1 Tax=Thalassotalea sp. LPB0316 TaxID=2769490 RepID=UPI0018680CA7|nr:tRNA glutamyl-Q(34) synthetase GluQRS [Thalassotalea sp. LPB0316]QOL26701.1 tRNA glutamyl-Q(34) synthetase GluQRS [Thalassotalea sp. LPB0316]
MKLALPERPQGNYRGRFAPSPSGLLHFGSLVTALASYLHAKQNHGQWLVRIEDIDPPREQAGASEAILKTLETYGLYWDEQVLYQSQQSNYYLDALSQLKAEHLSYYCQCTRAQIKQRGGIYDGHCKLLNHSKHNSAIRYINHYKINQFNDLFQGRVEIDNKLASEDCILFRKDGLFAYQLAVVVDDIYQQISHIIRGCDLLEPSARQLSLFATFGHQPPVLGHIPLAITEQGYKLSKQNKAPAINNLRPQSVLIQALQFLGQSVETGLEDLSPEEIVAWSVKNFQFTAIPKQQEIVINHSIF